PNCRRIGSPAAPTIRTPARLPERILNRLSFAPSARAGKPHPRNVHGQACRPGRESLRTARVRESPLFAVRAFHRTTSPGARSTDSPSPVAGGWRREIRLVLYLPRPIGDTRAQLPTQLLQQ